MVVIVRLAGYYRDMIMTTQLTGDWYTTKDAAKYLKLQDSTVRRYAHRGLIRVSRRIGICLLFRREDLDYYAANKRELGRPRKSKHA